ncbi:MAG: hemolysin family protein [Cyclobacteriaceae bacterium]|nr:hemolysin family protein [Cyclobacteriaceae bacterium]
MEFLIILILILINGFFSMSEISVVSARKVRLEAASRRGTRGANTALELATAPGRFLSTVQIGITLVGLLTGIYSGENVTGDVEAWLGQFAVVRPIADELSVVIVLLAITFCTLILGELVPKRVGLSNPEGIAMKIALFMKYLSLFMYPVVWVLTRTSDLILRLVGIRSARPNTITEEEIKAIIQQGTKEGEVQKVEQDIVERVFSLGDRTVGSLMTMREDLVFISIKDDHNTIRQTVSEELHRIYPVYEQDKDNVIGVVTLTDLFGYVVSEGRDLKGIVKPAHFLVETTSAYVALDRFKTSKVHYALVTNEYGLLLGMVTMDDILQALVGDVSDFHAEEYPIIQRADGTWLVDGQYPLPEFILYFDIEDVTTPIDINTIGGLILRVLNRIPKAGEKIQWEGLELEVVDMDNVKIDKILVRRLSKGDVQTS